MDADTERALRQVIRELHSLACVDGDDRDSASEASTYRRRAYWALRWAGEFELADDLLATDPDPAGDDEDDHGDDLAAEWGVRL